ncbi:hypothetical protein BSKO_10278 [Bryopsis sp. KO-2023]|nr:hypothetical protein BSKO_10278 [Bryopsis sp. KO-2023]
MNASIGSVHTGLLRKKRSDNDHHSRCLHLLHAHQNRGDPRKAQKQGAQTGSVDTPGTRIEPRLPQGAQPGKPQPRSAPKTVSWSGKKRSTSLVDALHSRTNPRKTKTWGVAEEEITKLSEDEALCGRCDDAHQLQPTSMKEALDGFGLPGRNKPSLFDLEERHGEPGEFLVCASPSGKDITTVLGVFDGHGLKGKIASTTVRDELQAELRRSEGVLWNKLREDPENCIKDTFAKIDNNLCLRRGDWSRSGTTGVALVIDSSWALCAWVGDSRAVLGRTLNRSSGSPEFQAIDLSRDHKPDDPKERRRILACSGRVDQMVVDALGSKAGPSRVFSKHGSQPGLAISRSFGDTMAKRGNSNVGVTSEPEFRRHTLTPCDKIIILASDGVWDVVSSQEAVNIVGSFSDPHSAAEALVAEALVAVSQQRWLEADDGRFCDDITATVSFLDHRKDGGHLASIGNTVPTSNLSTQGHIFQSGRSL